MFDDAEIEIPCSQCGYKNPKTLGWIKANNTFSCGGCGITIILERDELLRGLDEAEKSLDDLKRTFRDFSK